jgi:hypothetical protein
MEPANLPKILTARLHGKGPTRWTEDMGIDPMVEKVMRVYDMFELDALMAAHHLHRRWIAEEDIARDVLREDRLTATERIVYVEAALDAVAQRAWLGHFPSRSAWAQREYAVPVGPHSTLPSGMGWDQYIDWERLGSDVLDQVQYLVVKDPNDDTIWVFDNHVARKALRSHKRNKGEE